MKDDFNEQEYYSSYEEYKDPEDVTEEDLHNFIVVHQGQVTFDFPGIKDLNIPYGEVCKLALQPGYLRKAADIVPDEVLEFWEIILPKALNVINEKIAMYENFGFKW